MNKRFKKYIIDLEAMDSLRRREEAYINSYEYRQLYKEKNWVIIIKLIMGSLGLLLLLLITSKIHFFSFF
jgi:hypothetical protein